MRYTGAVTANDREVSDQVLAERLAATVERIKDGQAAQREQNRLVREAHRRKWSQSRIAKALGVSQQAISKRLNRPAKDATTE